MAVLAQLLTITVTAAFGQDGSGTVDQAQRPVLERLEPPSPDERLGVPIQWSEHLDAPTSDAGVSMQQVEQIAIAQHPAIRAAFADVQAMRGEWLQVGLYPNINLGYVVSEAGQDGKAGQQGGVVTQDFIRGNKLGLNRAVAAQQIAMRQQDLVQIQLDVLTDVRSSFYDLAVLQEREKVLMQLNQLTTQAAQVTQQLLEARETPRTDFLQATVENDRARLDLRSTRIALDRERRVLNAKVGNSAMEIQRVEHGLDVWQQPASWEWIESAVLDSHPRLMKAYSDVDRARWAVSRARAEVVPDLNVQAMVQYDAATEYTVAGVQTGMDLPIWNRNQGGISKAYAELRASQQRVNQVRLELRSEVAKLYGEYRDAHQQVLIYEEDILIRAAETQRLIAEAYRQGEVGFLDFLTAQRTFFRASLDHLAATQAYWQSWASLQGYLVSTIDGSLTQNNLPMPGTGNE